MPSIVVIIALILLFVQSIEHNNINQKVHIESNVLDISNDDVERARSSFDLKYHEYQTH